MAVSLILVLSLVVAIRAADEVCYNRLGCFTSCPPYAGTLERPIGRLPWAPEVVNTHFLLFTRENPDQYQVISALNISSVLSTNFNPNLKSSFVIHGFLEMGDKPWLVDMCQNILKVSNVNCFCVDWSGGAFALYTQAANNVRVVGAEIAYFLNSLQALFDYPMSEVHLIGHSLGAHVAGEAGKRQRGIGRISGLDPAGPYFEYTPPNVRLDPTDAIFVDAIHTDGSNILLHLGFGGYGMLQTSGNADFYPNGGVKMPGCDKIHIDLGDLDEIIEGLADKTTCNHHRSVMFFAESILRPDGFVGYPAVSYDSFQQGSGFPCTNVSCARMGYKADEYVFGHGEDSTVNQKFYLNTGNASNFLRWRYEINVTIDGFSYGSLMLSLCGADECSSLYEIYSGLLISGTTHSSFVDVDVDLDPIQKVEFVWHQTSVINILHPKLGASTVTVQYGPSGQTYKFCGDHPTEEDTSQTLEACS